MSQNNQRKSILDELASSIKLDPETEKRLGEVSEKYKKFCEQVDQVAKAVMESPQARMLAEMAENISKMEPIRPLHFPVIHPPEQIQVKVEKHYHIVLVPTDGKGTIH